MQVEAIVKPFNFNFDGQESVASMEVNSFAFQALSGINLYKNLIRAIIRELSCNAVDSHVMANKENVAFDIHLPTDIEPHFGIRDYGIGLDDNGVRKVYLTYFGSTKRDRNDQIGAWGLGSKSPLGYVDTFSLTSFKDGIKRVYVVYKNAEGLPAVKQMHEESTSEQNGVLVEFPVVSKDDFYKFNRECKTVFKYFPVKPNLNIELDMLDDEVSVELTDVVSCINITNSIRDGVKQFRSTDTSYVSHALIEYPIDMEIIRGKVGDIADLLRSQLLFKAENGQVSYGMSREELAYNDKTLDFIISNLKAAQQAMKPMIEKELEGLDCWNKYKKVESLMKHQLFQHFPKKQFIEMSPLHVIFHENRKANLVGFNFEVSKNIKCSIYGIKTSRSYALRKIDSAVQNFTFTPTTNNTFIVNDTKYKGGGLIDILEYNQDVIGSYSHNKSYYVFNNTLDDVTSEFEKHYGGCPNFVLVSSLKKPTRFNEKKAVGKSLKGEPVIRKLNSETYKFSMNVMDINDLLENEYDINIVKINGFNVDGDFYGTKFSNHDLYVMNNYNKIYGVNNVAYDLLMKNNGTAKVIDVVHQAKVFVEKYADDVKNEKIVKYVHCSETLRFLNTFKQYEDMSAFYVHGYNDSDFSKFDNIARILMLHDLRNEIKNIMDDKARKQLDMIKYLHEKYPLVYNSNNTHKESVKNELNTYIKLKSTGGF